MKQMEGTVVKVTEKFIVLMCSADGTFKNIPRLQGQVPLIGEKFNYKENKRAFFVSKGSWVKYASIACVLIVMVSIFSVFRPREAEAAYMVALDVNPSVEVYADKRLQVIRLKALNQDGKKIIREMEYKGKKVFEVVDSFIDQCVKQQYMKPNKKALIKTTIVPLQHENRPIETILKTDDVEKVIRQSLKENEVAADVEIAVSNEDILQKAHDLDLSVNKYEVYKKLKEEGYSITVDEVKEQSIQNLEELGQKSNNGELPMDARPETGDPKLGQLDNGDQAKPVDDIQAETTSTPSPSASSDMNSANNQSDGSNPDENHQEKTNNPAEMNNPADRNDRNVPTDPSDSANADDFSGGFDKLE